MNRSNAITIIVVVAIALSQGIGPKSKAFAGDKSIVHFDLAPIVAAYPSDADPLDPALVTLELRLSSMIESPKVPPIDQWMVQCLCQALRRARVLLFSDGIPREAQRELFVEPVASPEEGIERALAQLGPAAPIAVLPQGPYVLATVGGEKRSLGRDA